MGAAGVVVAVAVVVADSGVVVVVLVEVVRSTVDAVVPELADALVDEASEAQAPLATRQIATSATPRSAIERVSHPHRRRPSDWAPTLGETMTVIARDWVALTSSTGARAGHGPHPCQGLYHRPEGTQPTVACIATHYNVDFSEHYLAELLAERGLGFLGWNTRYRGNEAFFMLEPALIDIAAGVRWLSEEAGVDTVVVLGNSGGGSLMGAYLSQALDPSDALDLPGADLYISLNAHPGRPEVLTAWMDPSVTDETDPLSVDPDLDMFRRSTPFDAAFVSRYRAAQEARNNRITAWVRAELDRLQAAGAWDRMFNIHRVWADLRFADLSLDPSDRRAGCYAGDPKGANYGPFSIGGSCTLRTWLSMWSLEASRCRGAAHLRRVTVPSLVVQSLADRGVFPSDARAIHDALASDDKTLELVAGEHYFETGGRPEVADLLTEWIGARA